MRFQTWRVTSTVTWMALIGSNQIKLPFGSDQQVKRTSLKPMRWLCTKRIWVQWTPEKKGRKHWIPALSTSPKLGEEISLQTLGSPKWGNHHKIHKFLILLGQQTARSTKYVISIATYKLNCRSSRICVPKTDSKKPSSFEKHCGTSHLYHLPEMRIIFTIRVFPAIILTFIC